MTKKKIKKQDQIFHNISQTSPPPNINLIYDEQHGKKHFTSRGSQWNEAQNIVNPALEKVIMGHEKALLQDPTQTIFYIRESEAGDSLRGYDKLARRNTDDITLQIERKSATSPTTFFYHGYPEVLGNGKEGIGPAKNKTGMSLENNPKI